jgi:UDP-N-acetylglucosamine--N-acetylmuramyl-(pentapeptide) pyrophosphoryl-undecaprenol N-acetylglucosamine transferase
MNAAQVAYYVHGRGQGHASRALSVVPALRAQGLTVALFGAADALPMLRALGEPESRALLERGLRGQRELLVRVPSERRVIAKLGARLVITDGDQAALLAAFAAGVPSIAIGHDLVFSRCVLQKGLPRLQLLEQRVNGLLPALLSTRRVAVHFLPVQSCDPRTRVARVEVARPPSTVQRADRLLCYFRDGRLDRVVRWAEAHCAQVLVLAPGRATGTQLARADFRSLLMTARGAIGSAGSNLIAECLVFGTPLLALYRRNDAEQALNARMLEAADAGVACAIEDVCPEVIARFMRRAHARDFREVPLVDALPSVVASVLAATRDLLDEPTPRASTRAVAP